MIYCESCPKAKKKKTKSGYEYLVTPVNVCGAECVLKQGEKAKNTFNANYYDKGNAERKGLKH